MKKWTHLKLLNEAEVTFTGPPSSAACACSTVQDTNSPSKPSAGQIPKTNMESRERWKQDVCMHPGGGGKGGNYCNRKPWGLKVARPKSSQFTPYSAPYFQDKTPGCTHKPLTQSRGGQRTLTRTKQGWAVHTH